MTKEITKKQADVALPMEAWGTEGVDSTDILIPKILLAQGLSEAVTEEKVKMGDMYDSVTNQVLGNAKQGVKFVPLKGFKTWINFRKEGGKLVYENIEPVTPENKARPWETETHRHDECINYYVMLADDLAKPDALPYLISFRRTSYTAGKKLETFRLRAMQVKKPLASTMFILKAEKKTNDDGTFYVFDVEPAQATTQDQLKVAYQWYQTLNQTEHKVDNSDIKEATRPVQTNGATVEVGARY